MNIALLLLTLIVIILIIYFIIISIQASNSYNDKQQIIFDAPSVSCVGNLDTLQDVSSDQCCVIGDFTTNFKYNSILGMVVSDVPTYYITVCQPLCTGTFNESNLTCTGSGQDDFNQCLTLLKPNNCIGLAMPVGHDGITLYYALNIGRDNCQITSTCVSL